MVKTLRPMGNSYGIIIDRPILDLLDIKPGTELSVTTQDGGLLIKPIRDPSDHKTRVRRTAARMASVHRKSLEDLAD
jgi:antitoxin component of MazEF toxin-antitoxin module